MAGRKPVYKDQHDRYEIDRCEPQQRAIQSGKIDYHGLTKGHYLGRQIPHDILPGLNSIGFWNAGAPQDWGLNPHRNEGIEIMFLETGTMAFEADGRQFKLCAGDFTITRPWQLHKLGSPHIGPGRLHWLILDVGVRRPHQNWCWPKWLVLAKDDLAELTWRLRHNETPVWTSTPAIARSFVELAGCVSGWGRPRSVSRLAASLNLLLVQILDVLTTRQVKANRNLASHRRTVEIFLEDLKAGRVDSGEAWTLDGMAGHCGMGKSTLSKYCLELTNAGPVDFLNRCRLENAARRLRVEPERSVTDIAMAGGFNSSQYFATAFARTFNCSPTEYRTRHH